VYKKKRFLAIIPARSGSKGLPGKNIRELLGKPLIAYSIEAALATGLMDSVIVSTDWEQYAEIARCYGAEVPFLRPKELAGDSSLASDYVVHAIETMKNLGQTYDYFVLLQPTSPLRKPEHIMAGVQMAVDEGLTAVVSFSESEQSMGHHHRLPPDMSLFGLNSREFNRQSEKKHYYINGLLYLCDCETYLATRSFYVPNSKALVIDGIYAVDIDNYYDFLLAEFLMTRGMKIDR